MLVEQFVDQRHPVEPTFFLVSKKMAGYRPDVTLDCVTRHSEIISISF